MLFLLPPVAAFVFTILYLFSDDPRPRSKVVVIALLTVAILLQFGTGYVLAWALGILLSVAIAICLSLYFSLPC